MTHAGGNPSSGATAGQGLAQGPSPMESNVAPAAVEAAGNISQDQAEGSQGKIPAVKFSVGRYPQKSYVFINSTACDVIVVILLSCDVV